MPPRTKRRRGCCPHGNKAATLPAELLLEITARSDAAAVFRFAATCRLLRHEIQSPAFVHRVCNDNSILSSRLHGFLNDSRSFCFTLVHPRAPAAVSFARDSIKPVVSRGGGLLQQYLPLTSRGGLVLLQRRYSYALKSFRENLPDMCVYDPMTNGRTFLSYPPDIGQPDCPDRSYVLLTAAADGIGCSFLVVALQYFILQEAISSSDAGGQWGPAARANVPSLPPVSMVVHPQDGAVVVDGVVHWLVMGISDGYAVFTYDAARAKMVGAIKLPQDLGTTCRGHPYLGSSPDGKLAAFGTREFVVYLWVLSSEGTWARHAQVDTAPMLRLLLEPSELRDSDGDAVDEWPNRIKVEAIGDKRSSVVLLRLPGLRRRFACRDDLFVLDMVTRKILRVTSAHELSGTPYEVDLFSRLSAMKTF